MPWLDIHDVESGSMAAPGDGSFSYYAGRSYLGREHRVVEFAQVLMAGLLPWLVVFMFLVGMLPFSFLVFLLVLSFFVICVRTFALTSAMQRLQAASSSSVAELVQRPSLFMLGGRPINLLNLRLSLMDRDFNDGDFEVLLALDSGAQPQGPPLSEAQMAALPTYSYRRPHPCAAGSSCSGRCAAAAAAGDGKGRLGSCSGYGPSSVDSSRGASVCVARGRCGQGGQQEEGGEEEDAPTCSVCLDGFSEGVGVTVLPCRHQFHSECIRKWMRQRGASVPCPVCKQRVFGST